jgi:putative membrane protein
MIWMRAKIAYPVAVLLCCVIVMQANPASAARFSSQDKAFVRMADQSEIGNVRIAALALRKSAEKRVVSFATRIRDVDAQLHGELCSIANAQRLRCPRVAGRIYETQLERLRRDSGSRFNLRYLRSQLRTDQQVLSAFQAEAARGTNSQFTAFAKETIPLLDQHIWLVRQDISGLANRRSQAHVRPGE